MRKKFFIIILTFAIARSFAVPYSSSVLANEYDFSGYVDDEENGFLEQNESDWNENDDDEDTEIPEDIELTPEDIKLSVSNKKINVGSSFKINIEQANPDDWEQYAEDDWEQCCEDYIESIEYKSKKSYIAKVSNNGIVKGKRRGKTTIMVTVYFKSGAKKIMKIQVQVRK